MKCVIFWLVQCRGSGFQHPLGQPSQLSLSHSVSAGPTPECQKPSEKCSFFPQGYSRFFKEKEVTALAAVIFILQLTEPSSKEVSGILFKFFFFFPKKRVLLTLVVTSAAPTTPIPATSLQASSPTASSAGGGRASSRCKPFLPATGHWRQAEQRPSATLAQAAEVLPPLLRRPLLGAIGAPTLTSMPRLPPGLRSHSGLV